MASATSTRSRGRAEPGISPERPGSPADRRSPLVDSVTVNPPPGWRTLQKPPRYDVPTDGAFVLSPFTRLARVHTLTTLADGFVAVALAGSVFFSVSPDDARGRVALYLLLTIAPFAVVTPLIGPAVDRARGGRRTMIIATNAARVVLAFFMIRDIDRLLLFPEAFGMLVLQKGYSVAKSASVPSLAAGDDALVEANSKLALLSAVSGMSGAAVGALFVLIGGPALSVGVAMLVYVAATLASLGLPAVVVAPTPAAEAERVELRSTSIVMASTAMALLRAVVGFLTFLVAFEFRGGEDGYDLTGKGSAVGAGTAIRRGIDIASEPGAPAWHFGVVLFGAGIGTVVGARVAPELRKHQPEENILAAVLGAVLAAALLATWGAGVSGAFAIALAVSLAAAAGKLAFDSLVQRDAPDANYGRSFARFEARFQLMWASGAFLAVMSPIRNARLGYFTIAVLSAFALFSYLIGIRSGRAVSLAAWRRRRAGRQPVARDTSAETTPGLSWPADPTIGPAPPPDTNVPDTAENLHVDAASADQTPSAPTWYHGSDPLGPVVSASDGVQLEDRT